MDDDALLPWAAYVVGHHRFTARLLLELYWNACIWVPRGPEPWYAPALREQLAELDEALYRLGIEGIPTSSLHVEVRRALDQFRAICHEVLEGTSEEPLIGCAPGCAEWERLRDACSRVIPDESVYAAFYRLGDLVGEVEYNIPKVGEGPPVDASNLASVYRFAVQACHQLFRGDLEHVAEQFGRIVEELRAFGEGPVEHSFWVRGDLELAAFDENFRHVLRQEERIEPWLDITPERMLFLGRRFELKGYDPQLAMLRVLAEEVSCPPRPVTRTRLRQEIGTPRREEHIPQIATRLRKHYLEPAVASYFAGVTRPAESALCFIASHEGGYMLSMPPTRVRVIGPRPAWMRQRDQQG